MLNALLVHIGGYVRFACDNLIRFPITMYAIMAHMKKCRLYDDVNGEIFYDHKDTICRIGKPFFKSEWDQLNRGAYGYIASFFTVFSFRKKK